MEALLRRPQSTESPRGPMGRYQEGHRVRTGLSIVAGVCPLNQKGLTTERRQCYRWTPVVLSRSLVGLWGPLGASGCLWVQNTNQPVSVPTPPSFFIPLNAVLINLSSPHSCFLFNLPRPMEYFQHLVKQKG